jgi:membrane associated rhomboid family serine protease
MNSVRRSYSFGFGSPWTPAVKVLIIINVAVFAVQSLVDLPFSIYLGLVPYQVIHHYMIWQLFTYMFLHGGVWHVLFNMFALWMFGPQLERVWGSRGFLKYYFITGVGAALIDVAFNYSSMAPTIGASGAIFGLLVAYGVLFPDNVILLYFLIPIKAKYFVAIFAGLELLMEFNSHSTDGVAHLAHLGGMAVGFLYLKGGAMLRPLTWRVTQAQHEKKEAKQVKLEVRRLTDMQAIHSEVDYLLGRISRVGYENLTPEEKERLEEASRLLRLHSEGQQDLS